MPLHTMDNKYMSKGLVPNDRLHTVRASGAVKAFQALVFVSEVNGLISVKTYDGDTNTTRQCLGFAYTAAGDGDEFVLIGLGPIVKGIVGTDGATAGGDAFLADEAGGLVEDGTMDLNGTTETARVGMFLQSGVAGDVVQILMTGIGLAAV